MTDPEQPSHDLELAEENLALCEEANERLRAPVRVIAGTYI